MSDYGKGYFKMPKPLLKLDISNESKILYALLLDRRELSVKNKYMDSKGVYCFFSREEACELLHCRKQKTINTFKELKKYGLIEEEIRRGKAPKIYVKKWFPL